MKTVQNLTQLSWRRKFSQKLELLIAVPWNPKHTENALQHCVLSLSIWTGHISYTPTPSAQNGVSKVSTNKVHQRINQSFSFQWRYRSEEGTKQLSAFRRFPYFHIFYELIYYPKAIHRFWALISDRKQNCKTRKSWTFIVQLAEANINEEVSFIPMLEFHQQESKMLMLQRNPELFFS
jgi:hypothetical protein